MASPGRIQRRLALAILLTALIPLLAAIWLARKAVTQTSERFFLPEVGMRLDQSLTVYQELARAIKASMRHEATAIAAQQSLRDAAAQADKAAVKRALEKEFPKYPNLVSLTVLTGAGERMARVDRGRPLDAQKENPLEVTRPLSDTEIERGEDPPDDDEVEDEEGPRLVAVFAADKARFLERDEVSQFVDTYKMVESRRQADENSYLLAFAALLGITIVVAVGVGSLMARGVASRIGELADATKRVGAGDLSTRVPEDGSDEIADLARAFNHMLSEVETSRARIEYLQRIGAWQEMARRLAHEIKNPLTPIQLAVQEIHRRYEGGDERYKKLVDTTLEIVEDEVGTLRRLVSEFSEFARLPQAELTEADLAAFLREQRVHLALMDEDAGDTLSDPGGQEAEGVELSLELPDEPALVNIDRQMLRRALINLVRNAVQAAEQDSERRVLVKLTLKRDGDFWQLDIDDNGPGIPEEMRLAVFDPYVTTKHDGTGLGLAIVKKIVVEHGGNIQALTGALGGARMRLRLPVAGTPAGIAALESRDWQGPPSSGRPSFGRAAAET